MEQLSLRNEIHCAVCGLKQEEPFFDGEGNPNWNICHCCGFMAGYTDDSKVGVKSLREHWLNVEQGHWFLPEEKPPDWCLEEQLKQIPREYR